MKWMSGRISRAPWAPLVVLALAAGGCTDQVDAPTGPDTATAFAKGGKGVGGGAGGGQTGAPGGQEGGGKVNAPGKGGGGGGGGGGGSTCGAGCTFYNIVLSGVCFDGPNIGCDLIPGTTTHTPDTYDLAFKVGDYVGDLESTKSAPCPTGLPGGVLWPGFSEGVTQPTWLRYVRGNEVWCELPGIYQTSSPSEIQIQLPYAWDDGVMIKGDIKFQLFGRRGDIDRNTQIATFRYCTEDYNDGGSCTTIPDEEMTYTGGNLVTHSQDTTANVPAGFDLDITFFLAPRPGDE
jgi:hypothetical protein